MNRERFPLGAYGRLNLFIYPNETSEPYLKKVARIHCFAKPQVVNEFLVATENAVLRELLDSEDTDRITSFTPKATDHLAPVLRGRRHARSSRRLHTGCRTLKGAQDPNRHPRGLSTRLRKTCPFQTDSTHVGDMGIHPLAPIPEKPQIHIRTHPQRCARKRL